MMVRPPSSTLFPYTTLFRSTLLGATGATIVGVTTLVVGGLLLSGASAGALLRRSGRAVRSAARSRPRTTTTTIDRKSTRLNSSHGYISYAVFCLKKKKVD